MIAPNPALGAANYLEKCAPCHGVTGQGDGPQASQLPNPTSPIGSLELARASTPAEWFQIVTEGNIERYMPPFSSLSDRQRWDVLAYVYTLSSIPERTALGEEVYIENCSACHGITGRGDGPQAAELSRTLPDFTNQAYMATKSTTDYYNVATHGFSPDMPAFDETLRDEERWAVADYLRFFSFSGSAPRAESPTSTPFSSQETQTPSESEPASPEPGAVIGEVINGTQGSPIAGQVVTLHGFDGMQVGYTATATTDENGVFVFEDVEMVPGRRFLATTEFQDATYGSNIVTVVDGQESITFSITAHETTTDTSTLRVDRLHIFVNFSKPDVVQVAHYYIMSNTGNKPIVPAEDGKPVVTFPLPPDASNLQFQDGQIGERFVLTENGFGDTVVVWPGLSEHTVLYAFELPYDRKLDLVQPISLPIHAVVLLQQKDGVRIRTDHLIDEGVKDFQGENFHMYSGGPFEPGSNLALSFSGQPGPAFSFLPDPGDGLLIGLGAFGFMMIVAGVWLYRRNQAAEPDVEEDEEEDEEAGLGDDRDSLIEAIIALDDLYQAGELPEDAYRTRRAELKNRLKELNQ
jgi:mono/diheme cytochrome c family protein